MIFHQRGMIFCEIIWVYDLPLDKGNLMLLHFVFHSVYYFIPLHYALLMLQLGLLCAAKGLDFFQFMIALHIDAANSILRIKVF